MIFNKKSSFSGVMTASSRLAHLVRFTAFCVLFPLTISTVAAAPPAATLPPTACDPEYMDALESRAWLEAQREITQNQNLISKPDSVLEYTCFNRFLNQMSHNFSDRLFSESGHWGGVIGISATSTDDTLDNVVRTTTLAYLSRNFEHNFLGDRLPGIDYHADDAASAVGNNAAAAGGATGGMPPVGNQTGSADTAARGATEHVNGAKVYPVTGIAYDCDRMAKVWELARCLNFMQRPDKESFFDFPWYTTHDPRDLPQGFASCQSPTAATGGNNAITDAMQSAFNGDAAEVNLYTLEQDNDPFADTTRYNKDPIVSHLNLISPIGQNNVQNCGGSIQTGITVVRDQQNYPEVICTNPGCAQPVGGGNCTPQ